MKEKRKKIPFNTGKLEFIAALESITPLFSMGHTKLHIFNEMTKCGKFTMSYDTFCYHMRIFHGDKEQPEKPVPNAPARPPNARPVAPASGPRFVSSNANKFPDPRDMNLDDAL